MPAKKTTNRKTTGKSKSTGKRYKVKSKAEERSERNETLHLLLPFVILVLTVLIAICLYGSDTGTVGGAVKTFLIGISGNVAYVFPVFVLLGLIVYYVISKRKKKINVVMVILLYLFIAAAYHILSSSETSIAPAILWNNAVQMSDGGGVLGGLIGGLSLMAFGKVASVIIIFLFIIAFIVVGIGISLTVPVRNIEEKFNERKELRAAERHERIAYNEEKKRIKSEQLKIEQENLRQERIAQLERMKKQKEDRRKQETPVRYERSTAPSSINSGYSQRFHFRKRKLFYPNIPIDGENPSETDGTASATASVKTAADAADSVKTEAAMPENNVPVQEKENKQEKQEGSGIDLNDIFVSGNEDELLKKLTSLYIDNDSSKADVSIGTQKEPEKKEPEVKKPVKPEYVFPPINLLTKDKSLSDPNVKEELHRNATKLVSTLESFNVKTKIENISRGPTITRYELLPESGTRVRSILNLVDDISLNLATTGVRIEAPIPGKSAVGIEVPNAVRQTVHLRTLLESPEFKADGNKLNCGLGADVAGANVYLNIGKMPHLLIAGATGAGKSICINTLIVSLLYNASYDDVKLILIDPKKVEFNLYSGIPHLLVPVVTSPKKAAGALAWAVCEMERRFELIETVGVRDLDSFNVITKDDPQYEHLPYIVIIIDELADLMMTAPKDVEDSLCRLMQKARAAGMYVIIGTQRPSVDVITGLIKANIPSRIALMVASQVDSRTIIDRAGAENLIGRGDMLYYPVGFTKPIRVQGAFVSDKDIESVVAFIKKANSKAGTDVDKTDEIMKEIELEAQKCDSGNKRSSSAAIGQDANSSNDDPMLDSAAELAFESGKISTSLIQRRLSLGYGRAAKLIDRLQELGIVSEPEGQKPREVIMSKETWLEMRARRDENDNTGG